MRLERRARRCPSTIGRAGLLSVLIVALVAGVPGAGVAQSSWTVLSAKDARPAPQGDPSDLTAPSNPVLEVPFVGQSELMCGAAAVVMTLRYWGDAETRTGRFAPLVRESDGGIRARDLARSTEALGWDVRSFQGDLDLLRHHLARGRPVVTLIEVGEGRFHYVTIVGWLEGRLLFHDPAISPYQWMNREDFDRAWESSGRWAMLILPATGTGDRRPAVEASDSAFARPRAVSASSHGPMPRSPVSSSRDSDGSVGPLCEELLRRAASDARATKLDEADESLRRARMLCPGDPLVNRELAALRLRQGRPGEAVVHARRATALDSTDHLSRELLAAGYFLQGDDTGALGVWHRLGRARLGHIELASRTRTRQRVIVGLSGLEPGEPLTPETLGLSRRRLEMLPSASGSRVDYRPRSDGRVDAEVAVTEHPAVPISTLDLFRHGISAAVDQEIGVQAGSLLRAGELWTLGWRWETPRRGLTVGLDIPGHLFQPGIWSVRGELQRESYAYSLTRAARTTDPGETWAAAVEERRRASLGFSLWTSQTLRWSGTLAVDHWEGAGTWGSIGLAARLDGSRGHFTAMLGGEAWWSGSRHPGFARGEVGAAWRSGVERRGLVVHLRTGASWVTPEAPGSVWPGAGTGSGRPALARAHPLLADGVVTGPLFGRGLVHGGLETVWWATGVGPLKVAPATFVEFAYATQRPEAILDTRAFHTDAGVGVRLGLPGGPTLRLDVARGLRDGATAWSISFDQANAMHTRQR